MRLNLAHQGMSWGVDYRHVYNRLVSRDCCFVFGGSGRNRTGVDGFAIRCITTLPPSLVVAIN